MEHRFEFRQGDLTLCISGERDFVETMVARYLPTLPGGMAPDSQNPVTTTPPPVAPQRPPAVHKNISLLDFIHLKEVTDPSDAVLALVYYLEKYDYLPNVDLDDLRPHFDALELDEATAKRALQTHSAQSLIIEEGGRYSLSFSGEQRVKYGDFPSASSQT